MRYTYSAWASALLVHTEWVMRRPCIAGRVTGTDSHAFFVYVRKQSIKLKTSESGVCLEGRSGIVNLRKLLFLLVIYCALNSVKAQTLYTCNGKYRVELPDKLELQDSELNTVKRSTIQGNKLRVNINTSSGHITFQQKGLNAGVKGAYNRYCRVIIEYFQEDRNVPTFGRGDQIVVDKEILYTIAEVSKESCLQSGTPFIKLISVQPLSINGFPVLYYSYKRKGWEGKQPPVVVNVFRIFNRYESVTLTFSYREMERETWKSIHNNIIKTFCFTKKY